MLDPFVRVIQLGNKVGASNDIRTKIEEET